MVERRVRSGLNFEAAETDSRLYFKNMKYSEPDSPWLTVFC